MAIFSFSYIIYICLYQGYKDNDINQKMMFNVAEFEKMSKMVTLTSI